MAKFKKYTTDQISIGDEVTYQKKKLVYERGDEDIIFTNCKVVGKIDASIIMISIPGKETPIMIDIEDVTMVVSNKSIK